MLTLHHPFPMKPFLMGLLTVFTLSVTAQTEELVTAGLGPLTVSYSHNLTPLFRLSDVTKARPSSLSVGLDLWYFFCRFTHPKKDRE